MCSMAFGSNVVAAAQRPGLDYALHLAHLAGATVQAVRWSAICTTGSRGGLRVRLGEPLPPARVAQPPPELALRFRVRGATGLGTHDDCWFTRHEPREPGGDAPRRLRAQGLGEHRQPRGLGVDDVVDGASCSSASTVAAAASSRWMKETRPPPRPTIGYRRLRTSSISPSLAAS